MAEDDYIFPATPIPSAIMPERESNFLDPSGITREKEDYKDQKFLASHSLFKMEVSGNVQTHPHFASGLLSNALATVDYDFSLFNQYVHYIANPAGGRGLMDQTSFDLTASIIYSRSGSFISYSPYG